MQSLRDRETFQRREPGAFRLTAKNGAAFGPNDETPGSTAGVLVRGRRSARVHSDVINNWGHTPSTAAPGDR